MPDNDEKETSNYSLKLKLDYLLTDVNTRLPTLSGVISKLKDEIELFGALGFIVVNVPSSEEIESVIGWSEYERFLREFANILKKFKNYNLDTTDMLFIRDVQSCEFVYAISLKKEGQRSVATKKLAEITNSLKEHINSEIEKNNMIKTEPLDIEIGFSQLLCNPSIRTERQIYLSIDKARQSLTPQYPKRVLTIRKELSEVISKELIETLFQPIINLKSRDVLGYEALSKGTLESTFNSPETLFNWAERLRLDLHLDIMCRKKAFERAKSIIKEKDMLFLNTIPRSIDNPDISLKNLKDYLRAYEIDPTKVVLELTERTAIENYESFEKNLKLFRGVGFNIAIDDAGAGYASLNTIAQLKPEFLKFDMALVHNLHKDPIKQELLIILLNMAEKIGAQVIAEGIETEEELKVLLKFGVNLGQGYFIGKPQSYKMFEGN